MTVRRVLLPALLLAAAAAVPQAQSAKGGATADCVNAVTGAVEGVFTYDGPTTVWPPNHQYVTATISLTDADDEPATDDATVAVVGSHDEVAEDGTEFNGTGNTDPATDSVSGAPGAGNPTASTTVSFRAERSGHKWTDGGDPWRGRTYTFTVDGTTDSGTAMCNPVTFTAVVPHDQGNHYGSS